MQASSIRVRSDVPRGPLWSALAVVLATVGCAPPGPRTAALELQAMQRRLPEADLSYYASGPADATRLILVHGTPGSAAGWADYLHEPPVDYEVIALDRPGFGTSGPDGAVPRLDAQARAVAALLPADGRRAVLLGHSLGGPIVARVAAEHPDRVSALVLLAASLDPAQERIHPLQHIGTWAAVRALLPRAIRNANAELMGLEAELQALTPWLAKIRCPVFIVHGTQDDLVPMANVSYMQAKLSAAACVKTRLLEGHNHFLPWNAESDVRQVLAAAARPNC